MTLFDGEIILSGPASKQCHFALATKGTLGSREITNIIRQLEIVRSFLEDDEASALASALPAEGDRVNG